MFWFLGTQKPKHTINPYYLMVKLQYTYIQHNIDNNPHFFYFRIKIGLISFVFYPPKWSFSWHIREQSAYPAKIAGYLLPLYSFSLHFLKAQLPENRLFRERRGTVRENGLYTGEISGDPVPYFHELRSFSPRRPSSSPWRPSSYRMKSGFVATKTVVMRNSCLPHGEKPLSDPLFNSKTS